MIQKHPDMNCFDDEFIFIIGHFKKKRLRISFYFAYFIYSSESLFTSQYFGVFCRTCDRVCAVNEGRVICSGDGYSSS